MNRPVWATILEDNKPHRVAATSEFSMSLEFVPLLQLQRDLYDMPRGYERFKAYIKELVDPESGDMRLPLPAMNPMGKAHLPALLDSYIAQESDLWAAIALTKINAEFVALNQSFRVALVLADDAMGAWTNRYDVEFKHRFESRAFHRRGWLTGMLWSSEPVSAETAILETRTTVWRGYYILHNGYAQTLEEMLRQEGFAMSKAGHTTPTLTPDDLDYTRVIIAPHLTSEQYPTQFACLFGDEAAQTLGYEPMGLSKRAGLALALHDYRVAP